jgi:hypothetical protein
LDGATQLRESGNPIPALVLYREGFLLLARAHAAANGSGVAAADADARTTLDRFIDALPPSYATLARKLRENIVISTDAADLDALSLRELTERVNGLSAVTPVLLALLAPQTPARQKTVRTLQRAAILLVLVSCVTALSVTVLPPKNIALHKPATSSSVAFDTKPAGAVNGKVYEPFGFHSDTEDSPWLRIDLGRKYTITEARVYGRHDCCFDQSVPMLFEGSDDGETFRLIAERKDPFDQVRPWVILPGSARARFVRLRSTKKTPLVLAEVELNGKPVN